MFQCGTKQNYCPAYASLAHQTAITQNGTGVPLATYVAILSRGTYYMLEFKNLSLGLATQSRAAMTILAATLFLGGGITEASAKSRHHHRHHHSHHASNSAGASWRDANAAVTPSSGSGHSFSGMASFYGNESGSKTASGQRFNQRKPSPRSCVRSPM